MELKEVIRKRQSIRDYEDRPIPEDKLTRVLEAARLAPSASNRQPWKFIVMRDPELINGVTETVVTLAKKFKSIIDYRQPGCGWKRPIANLFIRKDPLTLNPTPFGAVTGIADGKLGLWHGAPTVIMIFKDVRGITCPELDCGIAGQNMVLAAHSMGLGTCWVSFAKMAFEDVKQWTEHFNITYPYKFLTSLAIGYPVGKPDGMVARTTHPVDWYENNEKKTIY